MEHILREYVKHRKWHFGYDSLFPRIRIAFLSRLRGFAIGIILAFYLLHLALNSLGSTHYRSEVRRLGYLSGSEFEFPMWF